MSDGLNFDAILASLLIAKRGDEIKMVAGMEFRAAGMDTLRVVVYDRRFDRWAGEGKHEDRRGVERRVCIVQGTRGVVDTIIDYMEGWA